MRPVAIAGRAASGKSTLARALLAHGYHRLAFADAIKERMLAEHGMVKGDPGSREMLIDIGETARAVDPDHWVKEFARRAVTAEKPIVCDDLRRFNEMSHCWHNGFILVRVDACMSVRRMRLAQSGLDLDFVYSQHGSETELEGVASSWWHHRATLNTGADLVSTVARVLELARPSK